MNRKSPYLSIFASTACDEPDFDDVAAVQRRELRKTGSFYAKTFQTLPINKDNVNQICCTQATIDTFMLNFDSSKCFIKNITPALVGQHNVDTVPEFIAAMIGGNQSRLTYSAQTNRCTIRLQEKEAAEFSADAADILGFDRVHFAGPCDVIAPMPPDLYRKFRPIALLLEACDSSYFGNGMQPILCSVDTVDLLPHSNTQRSLTVHFASPLWCRLVKPLSLYIRIQVVSASGSIVSFHPNSEITLQLLIRSTPFELL